MRATVALIGQVVQSRCEGRRMEVIDVIDSGRLLSLRPAKGDSEYTQWLRSDSCVLWPPEWVWMLGDQMMFGFAADNEIYGRKAGEE